MEITPSACIHTCRGIWIGRARNGVRGGRESAESDRCKVQGESSSAKSSGVNGASVCRTYGTPTAFCYRGTARVRGVFRQMINEPGVCKHLEQSRPLDSACALIIINHAQSKKVVYVHECIFAYIGIASNGW